MMYDKIKLYQTRKLSQNNQETFTKISNIQQVNYKQKTCYLIPQSRVVGGRGPATVGNICKTSAHACNSTGRTWRRTRRNNPGSANEPHNPFIELTSLPSEANPYHEWSFEIHRRPAARRSFLLARF